MHITLFKALKSVSMTDDQATEVVDAFEEYLAVKIKEANAGLEAKITGVEAQLKAITWLLGFIGVLITIMGLAPSLLKLTH
ncbi:hypothetical protein [Sphingomonas sp. BK481]|uniref:hypothetical protein n=1 Tax=Sphingomonas sp. BK481 TaxID=2586981 RepID=UPI0016151FDD|nr:hypothetical protein [Sphingomonas sp. BK481]MBB3588988.1 CHASE3 domain sensor protein [Sphingomonas sp. BK481]